MAGQLPKTYTLRELASMTGSELVGDPSLVITGVESLDSASSEDASFLSNLRYRDAMIRSKAGVVFLSRSIERPPGRNYLLTESPSEAFQTVAALFLDGPYHKSGFSGIHATAVIHPSAIVGNNVQIGPYVTVDQGANIGDDTVIFPHVSIGAGTEIGSGCLIHPHVTIRERCRIGNRVVIQPGAVIGSCGFGFSTDAKGIHTKLEQLGTVEIEDDVEIGANTTIDRGRFKKTLISKGTKIDNLVQIGHNVEVGAYNLIVSQSGISGSTKTGKHVIIGGQTGIVGHIEIADGVMIASKGGVSKSIFEKRGKYSGVPVLPLQEYNRQQVHLRKIAEYVKRLKKVEKKTEQLPEP